MQYDVSEWIIAIGNELALNSVTLLTEYSKEEEEEEYLELVSVRDKTTKPDRSLFQIGLLRIDVGVERSIKLILQYLTRTTYTLSGCQYVYKINGKTRNKDGICYRNYSQFSLKTKQYNAYTR